MRYQSGTQWIRAAASNVNHIPQARAREQYLYDALFVLADIASERIHDEVAEGAETLQALSCLVDGIRVLRGADPLLDVASLQQRIDRLALVARSYARVQNRLRRRGSGHSTPTVHQVPEGTGARDVRPQEHDQLDIMLALEEMVAVALQRARDVPVSQAELLRVYSAVLHGLRFKRSERLYHLLRDVEHTLTWLAANWSEYQPPLRILRPE